MSPTTVPMAEFLPASRQRARRWNLAFWISVLLIPLGVLLPCLVSIVAYRIWGDHVSAPIGLSALLWPIVGVAGTLLTRGARARTRRAHRIAETAAQLGMQYTPSPPREKYEFLSRIRAMENPHYSKGENLVEFVIGNWSGLALDYQYAYHWGTVTEVGEQTLVAFPTGFTQLPDMAIVPTTIVGRLENLLLGKGTAIPFPQVPEFDRRFTVVGESAAIVGYFSRELVDVLLHTPSLTVLVDAGRLLVFRRLTVVAGDEFPQLLSQAHRIATLLTAAAGPYRRA